MVNYEIFVRAAIRKMSGMNAYYHHTISTHIREDFTLREGKHTVRLGTFNGNTFMPFTKQLPGMISPLEQANAMLITTPDIAILEKGKSVKILPINWELTTSEKEDLFTR
jgi:molybdopterin molybdotransferase